MESPTHDLTVHHAQDSNSAQAEVASEGLHQDLVILIRPSALLEATVVREVLATRGTEALMLSLVPKFEAAVQPLEAVFVLDCSGSMRGARIEQAKRATSIFLRSLSPDCFFNIVIFGSDFRALHSAGSVAYDESSLQHASAFVDLVAANMGGTELFSPINFVLRQLPPLGTQRAVFLLTDGQVSNQQEIFSLVQNGACRVFSIGIGSGVSSALVNRVARVSHGSAAFVQDREALEPVCISMLRKAMLPSVSNMAISWPKTAAFRSQTKPPPMFEGDAFSGLAMYPERFPESVDGLVVTVTGDTAAGRLELAVPVPSLAKVVESEREALLHHLFARKLIKSVEETEAEVDYKEEAIQLSVLYSVLCSYTAFVSVEQVDGQPFERPGGLLARNALTRSGYSSKCSNNDHARQFGASLLAVECAMKQDISQLLSRGENLERLMTKSRDLACSSKAFYRSSRAKHGSERRMLGGIFSGIGQFTSALAIGILEAIGSAPQRCLRRLSSAAATDATLDHVPATVSSHRYPDIAGASANPARVLNDQCGVPHRYEHAVIQQAARTNAGGGSKLERLDALLRLARFDGVFAPSPRLQQLTGIDEHELSAWAEKCWGRAVSVQALTTANVLAHLTKEFGNPSERATWQLLAEKAEKWLKSQQAEWGRSDLETVDDLIKAVSVGVHAD